MKLQQFIIFVFFLSMAVNGWAQDLSLHNANVARKLIRTTKNTDDAQKKTVSELEKMVKALKPQKDSTEYFLLNGISHEYQLLLENNKMYLRNKPDTTAYFNHLYEMANAYEHCFPVLDTKKGEAKDVRATLQKNGNNLNRGANFFLLKQKYDQAYQLFYKYIELADKQLITATDSMLVHAYYNCMYVANLDHKYQTIIQLHQASLKHGTSGADADMIYCNALYQENQIDEWIDAIKDAIDAHSDQYYFYGSLIDYYISHQESFKAIQYAEELQYADPTNPIKNFVRGYVYQQTGKFKKAIECFEHTYMLKADLPQNLSSLGYCHVALAEEFAAKIRGSYLSAEDKAQLKKYYTTAETYLERCRQLMPDEPDYWAPALYKVYYNLNKGREMDEMERLLSGH